MFLAFISGITSFLILCREFNCYHLHHNVPFASFKGNKQNIPPYEKEICHIFYYFKAFIAGRDANSEPHQYENLQTPPSHGDEKEEGNHPTPASVFTQSILLQLPFSSSFPVLNQNNAMKYLILVPFHFLKNYNSRSLVHLLCIWFWCHWMPGLRKQQNHSRGILLNGSFTFCFRDWHKQKNLGYCPLKNTLTAGQFECNLEFTKDLDNNLYLPNIC